MRTELTREEFIARGWEEIYPGVYSYPVKPERWIRTDDEIARFIRKYADDPEDMIETLGLKCSPLSQ